MPKPSERNPSTKLKQSHAMLFLSCFGGRKAMKSRSSHQVTKILHLLPRLLYFVTYVLRLSVLVAFIHPGLTDSPPQNGIGFGGAQNFAVFSCGRKSTLVRKSHVNDGS